MKFILWSSLTIWLVYMFPFLAIPLGIFWTLVSIIQEDNAYDRQRAEYQEREIEKHGMYAKL